MGIWEGIWQFPVAHPPLSTIRRDKFEISTKFNKVIWRVDIRVRLYLVHVETSYEVAPSKDIKFKMYSMKKHRVLAPWLDPH